MTIQSSSLDLPQFENPTLCGAQSATEINVLPQRKTSQRHRTAPRTHYSLA